MTGSPSVCIRQAINEVVPPVRKRKFNGRTIIAAKTNALYDEHIRFFNSGRSITREHRAAWNRVLAQARRDDYADWVRRCVDSIEQVDKLG